MLEKGGLEGITLALGWNVRNWNITAFRRVRSISRPLPSIPPYVPNVPPRLRLFSRSHRHHSIVTMVTQDGSIPATESAFTQALHQPAVVKDQFDLLYASLCQEGNNDDDGSSCSSSPSVCPPRQRHRRRAASVSINAEESEDEEDKHQRASATAPVKATATKKRQRASDTDVDKPQRRAPLSPLRPRYDEEELRHSWKPLAPAGDDYMDLSATISSAGRRKAAAAAAPARGKGTKATAGAKGRCSGEGELGNFTYSVGPLRGEWLQTRKAVVSERTSVVPKRASTSITAISTGRAISPRTADATPSTTAKASSSRSSIGMHSAARSSGSTGSSNTNTSQHSRATSTFFSPRPRFLGLSPESGGNSGGLGGSGGSVGCKKRPVTGTARATTMGVGSASKSSLTGGTVSSSGGNGMNKGLPSAALFDVLKKSIFSPKAH